jgi:hypothetical protein|tara:strand:+ start:4385 stop:4936 length:552 start_codon:yes stop_codon:yes gene_type:complete
MAGSKKRFTETAKWEDTWFRRLKPVEKLFWQYVLDRCNNCGVWEVDFELAQFMIDSTGNLMLNQEEILNKFKNKITILEDGKKWLFPKFIEFQYGQLNPSCRPHLSVIKLLEKHNLTKEYKGLIKGYDTLKDKDKEVYTDKNKDKDKKKDISIKDVKILNKHIDMLSDIGDRILDTNQTINNQ